MTDWQGLSIVGSDVAAGPQDFLTYYSLDDMWAIIIIIYGALRFECPLPGCLLMGVVPPTSCRGKLHIVYMQPAGTRDQEANTAADASQPTKDTIIYCSKYFTSDKPQILRIISWDLGRWRDFWVTRVTGIQLVRKWPSVFTTETCCCWMCACPPFQQSPQPQPCPRMKQKPQQALDQQAMNVEFRSNK